MSEEEDKRDKMVREVREFCKKFPDHPRCMGFTFLKEDGKIEERIICEDGKDMADFINKLKFEVRELVVLEEEIVREKKEKLPPAKQDEEE